MFLVNQFVHEYYFAVVDMHYLEDLYYCCPFGFLLWLHLYVYHLWNNSLDQSNYTIIVSSICTFLITTLVSWTQIAYNQDKKLCFIANTVNNYAKPYQAYFIQASIQSNKRKRMFVMLDKANEQFYCNLKTHFRRPLR